MNKNKILRNNFSNLLTKYEYEHKNSDGKHIGSQCDTCNQYLPFNSDWGLCCSDKARMFTETIFEHFGCENHSSTRRDSKYINPDRVALLSRLTECERILTDIRPGYPDNTAKVFHLRLRHFLGRVQEARPQQEPL